MFRKIKLILTNSEKKQLVFLSFGLLILSLSETLGIGIIIPVMNLCMDVQKIEASSMLKWFYGISGAKDSSSFLFALIIIAISVFIFKALYAVFMLYLQQHFVGKVFNRLTSSILNSYLNKPYAFHFENNSSVLFKNISSEVGQFTSGFLTPLILISSEFLIIVGIFLLLMFVYPIITIVSFAVFSLLLIFMNFFFKKKIKAYSITREKYSGQMYKSALEALQSVKEIKIYNVQSFFVDKFSHAVEKYTDGLVKFSVVSGLPRYILETSLFISVFIILLVNVYYHTKFIQLIPMMTVIGIAFLRFLPSINKIYTNINMLLFSFNSLDIIYNILEEDKLTKNSLCSTESHKLNKTPEFIHLEQINFSYKTRAKPVFENLNLSIPLNHVIAFVGETGAGKSTLVDILAGLLMPARGNLFYFGSAITLENITGYRRKVGYVPQQIVLIDDTLEANIAFGIPAERLDIKQLEQAIKISSLESVVNNLPYGIKTRVGEKGIQLSGGQRQRIGIARALYRSPEILIMDEATSSLDGYTETMITKAIKELVGKITIIIVAHRLSTIENADVIYVIDDGRIVNQGKFEELLENSSAFQKIINHISKLERAQKKE